MIPVAAGIALLTHVQNMLWTKLDAVPAAFTYAPVHYDPSHSKLSFWLTYSLLLPIIDINKALGSHRPAHPFPFRHLLYFVGDVLSEKRSLAYIRARYA